MTQNEAINVAIPVAVFVMMFSLGIGTTKEDFQNALRTRTPFLIALMLQFLLVPFAGLMLITVQQQDAAIKIGIAILMLCPGGAISNVLTRIAGGDVALSVSITAITNILSIATLPTLSVLAAQCFVGSDASQIDIAEVTVRVTMIATVPVLLGVLARCMAPVFLQRYERLAFHMAFTAFLLITGWAVIGSMEVLREGLLSLGWQLAILMLLLISIGFATCWLFGIPEFQRIAVSIETGIQNTGLGLAVSSILWADPSSFPIYAIPSAVYGVLVYIVALPMVVILSRIWRPS
jgi:BASS family bile acid:Na+ symporter